MVGIPAGESGGCHGEAPDTGGPHGILSRRDAARK